MSTKNTKGDDRMVAVEEALGKSEQFIEKNQNLLMYIIIGVIVVNALLLIHYRPIS